MDRDEILEKSRIENKGRDMPKIEEGKSSARFAIIVGFVFIIIMAFLSLIAHSKMIYGIVATEFCLVFAMGLYNAIKKKERKYIIMTITNAIPFGIFTFMTVCELFQIQP